jgi:hypothetical protein
LNSDLHISASTPIYSLVLPLDPHAPAAQYPTTQYDGRNEARYGGEVNLNELAGEQRVKSNANSRVNALQPKKSSYSIKGASASKSSNATASGSGSGNANGNEPVVIGSSEDEIEEFSDGGLAKREIFNSIDIKGGAGKGKGKANEDDGVVTGARRGKESAVRAADAVSKKNVQLRRVSLDSSSRINGSDDFEAAPDVSSSLPACAGWLPTCFLHPNRLILNQIRGLIHEGLEIKLMKSHHRREK